MEDDYDYTPCCPVCGELLPNSGHVCHSTYPKHSSNAVPQFTDKGERIYQVITLCGSTRFKDYFEQINENLTYAGYVVLMPGVFGHLSAYKPTPEEKANLDVLHLKKIDMSDAIYVINVDGYIGDSTRNEIKYAAEQGKDILYMCPALVEGGNLYG